MNASPAKLLAEGWRVIGRPKSIDQLAREIRGAPALAAASPSGIRTNLAPTPPAVVGQGGHLYVECDPRDDADRTIAKWTLTEAARDLFLGSNVTLKFCAPIDSDLGKAAPPWAQKHAFDAAMNGWVWPNDLHTIYVNADRPIDGIKSTIYHESKHLDHLRNAPSWARETGEEMAERYAAKMMAGRR